MQTAFSFVSALVAMLPDGGFVRNFLAGGEKDPPRRQAAGYDKSQRACEPSDTSRDFWDSLQGVKRQMAEKASPALSANGAVLP